MLALLSRGTTRLFDVRLESAGESSHSPEDLEAFSIDTNVLSALLPSPVFPWRRVAGVCGPVYNSIQTMLNDDMENVARLLSELGPLEEQGEEVEIEKDIVSDVTALKYPRYSINTRPNGRRCESLPLSRHSSSRRIRRRSASPLDRPLFIPSTHPSAPSILITPCQYIPRSTSSWVPLQDASYGNKLAVPGYPTHNSPSSFPPQNTTTDYTITKPGHAPLVERWKWREGHWWAVIPDIETQARKGWYSRPVSVKRRASRPCRSGNVDTS